MYSFLLFFTKWVKKRKGGGADAHTAESFQIQIAKKYATAREISYKSVARGCAATSRFWHTEFARRIERRVTHRK